MKKIALIIILINLFTHPVLPQQQTGKALEMAIGQLNQEIRIARDLLRLFPDKMAEDMIRKAAKLRDDALYLLERRQSRQAQAKIVLALDLIRKAVDRLSLIPMQRSQEQMAELMRRAEQVVPGSGNKEAERLLQRAGENQRMAGMAARRRQYQKAVEYLRVARFLAERSLSLVEGPVTNLQDRIILERKRFDELVQRAREAVAMCENGKAVKLVQQAQRQARNIEQAVARGEMNLALGLYYNATRLLLRAIDVCEGQMYSDREQALEEIEFLANMIETAGDYANETNVPRYRLIVQKASDLHRQAREAVRGEQYAMALRRIDLARSLLDHLWNRDTIGDRAKNELRRLQTEIEKMKSNPEFRTNDKFRSLAKAAENAVQNAERFLLRGRLKPALAAILIGQRFVNLSHSLATGTSGIDAEQARQQLNRLEEAIEREKDPSSDVGEKEDMLSMVTQLRDRALEALQQQNYQLAVEYVKSGFEIINKLQE